MIGTRENQYNKNIKVRTMCIFLRFKRVQNIVDVKEKLKPDVKVRRFYIYIYIGQIRLSCVTIYIYPTLSLIRSKVYSVFNYKERRFAIGAKPLRVGGRSRTDCLDVSYISEYKSLISTGERKTRQKGAEGGGGRRRERGVQSQDSWKVFQLKYSLSGRTIGRLSTRTVCSVSLTLFQSGYSGPSENGEKRKRERGRERTGATKRKESNRVSPFFLAPAINSQLG